ncbi:MAG: hypothetical protein IIC01_07140 [Planctomycetes bacterium]|nr:hypothetical protein [Planctomycetota bacterium]
MKRSLSSATIGVAMTLVLGLCAALSIGCGTIDTNGLFGLEPCDIFNCDTLFLRNLAGDHGDMAGMDDADAHDDEGDDHVDGVDDHDDDDDDHMGDMGSIGNEGHEH